MSGRGPEIPTGDGAGAFPAPQIGPRPPSPAERAIVARIPVVLAFIFVAALPFPGLVDVVEGASLALVTMLAATPIWYEAARSRNSPFDALSTKAIAVVLACTGFLILWSLLSIFSATAPMRAQHL